MANVFISYASPDYKIVQGEIVGLLKALGFDTWFAPENIRSAEIWKNSLLAGMESSDWFVVIVSARAAKSAWVKREVNWAFQHLPERIIPIVLDGCKTRAVDHRLPRVQHLDYGANRALAIQKLVKKLVDAEYRGFQRHLDGEWLCAVQPVYYALRRQVSLRDANGKLRKAPASASAAREGWHIQKVEIAPSSRGFVVDTVAGKGKLQWRWNASLESNAFLVGRWRSKRKTSQSHGYMSVQIARNGTYMFGHDYAVVLEEARAHYGLILFGLDRNCLEKAWSAMKKARRAMPPLSHTIDFPELRRG